MSLLVTGVFGDEMEVFAADDECSVHLCRNDGACQDTATDGDFTSERTFLVCVRALSAIVLSIHLRIESNEPM